ncbi:hypothetical protein DPMN_105977 [Dreissena polymorpha]|uniref:Uncharacterized protein n=1 Tax=Dreissena polymorpha TaxID=45954 RepID=A0A9D4K498_DREPO|nr:hypothetical protein DPMN_105977 [Dreissena polymorpha]
MYITRHDFLHMSFAQCSRNKPQLISYSKLLILFQEEKLSELFQEETFSKLRATLSKQTLEQRQKIVNHKINGNTSLFMACQQGKVHFVNYLIEECGADIEIKGEWAFI